MHVDYLIYFLCSYEFDRPLFLLVATLHIVFYIQVNYVTQLSVKFNEKNVYSAVCIQFL